MATFVGSYIPEMTKVLIASAVSGEHAIFLGDAGWTKSSLMFAAAIQMVGKDYFSLIRAESSSSPDDVNGHFDMKLFAQKQEWGIDTTKSAYDPTNLIVIADELYRANDPYFDAWLKALDRFTELPTNRPIVWATSNFVSKSERTQAVRDRFGLYFWVRPNLQDLYDISDAQMDTLDEELTVAGLPDWQTAMTIRSAKPGSNAKKAIKDMVHGLLDEISQGPVGGVTFSPSPRHTKRWDRLLFRLGMYYTGSNDFSVIPPAASSILQYAWPAESEEAYTAWQEIAGVVSDVLGSAIQAFKEKAFERFQVIYKSGVSDRITLATKLGEANNELMRDLLQIAKPADGQEVDERVTAVIDEINAAYAELCRGNNPF